jgi:hypothetical protein
VGARTVDGCGVSCGGAETLTTKGTGALMMTILWNNKPSSFDTLNVDKIWFERTGVRFHVAGVDGVQTAKLSEVSIILSTEAYAATGRQLDPTVFTETGR